MVKDIAPGNGPSDASSFTNVGGITYFINQRALWKTDGTAAGTSLVRSNFMAGGTTPTLLTGVDGRLMFSVAGGLWTSDGTEAGTVRVRQLTMNGSRAVLDGVLLMGAGDNSGGPELWRSDGTAAGTYRVKDILPGNAVSDPRELLAADTAAGRAVFFFANDASGGHGLWRTNGTEAGTVLLKSFSAATPPPGGAPQVHGLTEVDGTVYFAASDGTHGRELWKSDGTAEGTVMVADATAGPGSSWPANLTSFGGALYYTTLDGGLWRSDGTPAGTVRLAGLTNPRSLAPVSGGVALLAGPAVAPELWRTDGTAAGTSFVADVDAPTGLVAVGGAALFGAWDAAAGNELWRTDGTAAGTGPLRDIYPGRFGSFPARLTHVGGGAAYFVADDGVHGAEVWRTDGTAANTSLVFDAVTTPVSSSPHNLFAYRDNIFFTASGPEGNGIYKSDGTPEGTSLSMSGIVNDPVPVGDILFFMRGTVLYRGDGTDALQQPLKDVAGAGSQFTVLNGRLVFTTKLPGDPGNGTRLWSGDGTAEGTVVLGDYPGSPLRNFTVSGNKLFYFANFGTYHATLMVTDGTPQGTRAAGSGGYGYYHLYTHTIAFNGGVLYNGNAGTGEGETLWFSDGTAAGSYKVKDNLGLHSNWDNPKYFAKVGGVVYFLAPYGSSALWRTDGTAAGTYEVKAGRPFDAEPASNLTAVGNKVFYEDPIRSSFDLFASDGTTAGTVLVKQFPVDNIYASPSIGDIVGVDGIAYFTAPDGQWWRSDGTPAGTAALPAGQQSPIRNYVTAGSSRYFNSSDPEHGFELWVEAADGVTPPAAPTGLTAAVVGAGQVDLSWADGSTNETSFRVLRSTSPAFDTVEATVVLLPGTTRYSDTNVAGGTTYFYRVLARNEGGESGPASAQASTPAGTPAAPARLVATPATGAQSGRRVDLTWRDRSDNESGFTVERSTRADFATIERRVDVPADSTTFADTTVAPLTTYYYRVRAFNAAGASPAVATSARTPDVLPAAPSALAASPGSNYVELRWVDQATNETRFLVERSAAGGPFVGVAANLGPNATRFTDHNLQPFTTYRYRVRASGTAGAGEPSNEVTVTTLAPELTAPVLTLPPVGGPAAAFPNPMVVADGVGYFLGRFQGGPTEYTGLWRTDGTAEGTSFLKRVEYTHSLTNVDGTLFFVGYEYGVGTGIWKSDGTPQGTVFVKDINPNGNAFIHDLVGFRGKLYFRGVGAGGGGGDSLWVSDGTTGGTKLVKALSWRNGGDQYRRIVVMGDTMYLGNEGVWKSDGTPEGTVPVSSGPEQHAMNLTAAGDALYFLRDVNGGYRAFRSDGTAAGTAPLRHDLVTSTGDNGFVRVGGYVYFVAAGAGSTGWEVWRTDGTDAGTTMVTDVIPEGVNGWHFELVPFRGGVAFATYQGDTVGRVWVSDGTPGGTTLVNEHDRRTGEALLQLESIGDHLYFATEASGGWIVWRSDGTQAGTTALASFNGGARPDSFSAFANAVTFAADDGLTGRELWKTDGTPAGTVLVKDVTRPLASRPDWLTRVGDDVYFVVADTDGGARRSLWKTDGTEAGTRLVRDGLFNPTRLAAGGGLLYFLSETLSHGRELWRSDGTAAGTFLLKDLKPGEGSTEWTPMGMAGGRFVFGVPVPNVPMSLRLWSTDGTEAGTSEIAPLNLQPSNVQGRWHATVGGVLYFSATPAAENDPELWRTDGTAAGTYRVKDVLPGADGSRPTELVDANGTLYFFAQVPPDPSSPGYGLFRSDGTEAGTVLVRRIHPDLLSGNLVYAGGTLFFFGGDAAASGLWKSDGTEAGTVLVYADVAGPETLTAVDSRVFFTTRNPSDPSQGALWVSDGTTQGTARVRDLSLVRPGQARQLPVVRLSAGGKLFFDSGSSLWQSDGTFAGTTYVATVRHPDVHHPAFAGAPAAVTSDGRVLTAVQQWSEPWRLRSVAVAPPSAAGAPTAAAEGAALRVAWADRSDDESGFVLRRSASPDFSGTGLTWFMPAGATQFLDTSAPFGGRYYYRVTAVNAAGVADAPADVSTPQQVVGRHLFYNGSAADGYDDGANRQDDAAIARDKAVLLPGHAPTASNYTSFIGGINGVMIDVPNLPEFPAGAALSAADFEFKTGDGSAGGWKDAPAPASVTIRRDAGLGSSDRITLVWPDGAIRNTWLRITLLPGDRSGVASPEVFYVGSLVGDTGGAAAAGVMRVDAADVLNVRRSFNTRNPALIARFDHNRDGRVNSLDLSIALRNVGRSLAPVTSATGVPSASPSPAPRLDRPASRPERRSTLIDEAKPVLP